MDSIDAINKITEYLKDEFKSELITIYGFKVLLEIIFFPNIFSFDSNYFTQIKVIFM